MKALNLLMVVTAIVIQAPSGLSAPIRVGIGAMAAMSLEDTDYSERFKAGYHAAFYYAIGENKDRLAKCGYELDLDLHYYDKSRSLAPKKIAKAFEARKYWIVFGPGKSHDFLIAARGLTDTAMVSPMATAKKVTELEPPLFTMAFPTSDLARAAVMEANARNYGKRFGSVVDGTCVACRDFEESFIASSRDTLEHRYSISVAGTTPDLTELKRKLREQRVDFLLVPNYSQLSGFIISQLADEFSELKFIGGDGWGDGIYGSLTKYPISQAKRGFCVRPGMPSSNAKAKLQLPSLGYTWAGEPQDLSQTHFAEVEFVRNLTRTLCNLKPQNKGSFTKIMKQKSSDALRSSLDIGVYELRDGNLHFHRTIEAASLNDSKIAKKY